MENWPGDVEVQGPALMERMEAHAKATGAEVVSDHIARLELGKRPFTAIGDGGTVYTADAVVLATGAQAKWLGLHVGGDASRASASRPAPPATASSTGGARSW